MMVTEKLRMENEKLVRRTEVRDWNLRSSALPCCCSMVIYGNFLPEPREKHVILSTSTGHWSHILVRVWCVKQGCKIMWVYLNSWMDNVFYFLNRYQTICNKNDITLFKTEFYRSWNSNEHIVPELLMTASTTAKITVCHPTARNHYATEFDLFLFPWDR